MLSVYSFIKWSVVLSAGGRGSVLDLVSGQFVSGLRAATEGHGLKIMNDTTSYYRGME